MDFDFDHISLIISAAISTVIFAAFLWRYGNSQKEDAVRYKVKLPEAVLFPHEGISTDKLTTDVRVWV